MTESYKSIIILILLAAGFFLMFEMIRKQNLFNVLVKAAMKKMDAGTRQRLLKERMQLLEGEQVKSIWYRTERILYYSGLKWKYPFLSVEIWVVFQLAGMGGAVCLGMIIADKTGWIFFPAAFILGEFLVLKIKMRDMNRKVSEDLPKFLDFLGNYSITGGELCAILEQIARYMNRPLSDALEDCCRETELTGDMAMALLYMAEKIEHPQFKDLINELEINLRYCADYKELLQSSRRSLRDYMKASGERKGMMGEAVINACLLVAMSLISLMAVNVLIDESVWDILFCTLPGRISLAMITGIMALMAGKILQNGE